MPRIPTIIFCAALAAFLASCQAKTRAVAPGFLNPGATPLDSLVSVRLGPREDDPSRAKLRSQTLVNADLRGADLRGADLSGLDLRGINFAKANLQRANLSNARLAGTVFTQANLFRANFQDSAMQHAALDGYHLEDANLDGVWFKASPMPKDIFARKRFVGNIFSGVDLSGANFTGAILIGVTFHEADLSGASFRNAVFKGVSFEKTRVDRMDLTGARVELNGIYEGRDDTFVWITGLSENEVAPTVEQVQAELKGRTKSGDVIKHYPKPLLAEDVFAAACADPANMAELPPGMALPGAC